MARWLPDSGVNATVYGRGWGRYRICKLVEASHFPNDQLPELYGRAKLVLNDHWHDMRAFGLVSNRILDCLACGVPVLTDSFPELRDVFGDALLYAHNVESFRDQVDYCWANYENVLGRVNEYWDAEGEKFTFDYRAEEIVTWINEFREGASNVERPVPALTPAIYESIKETSLQYEEAMLDREQYIWRIRRSLKGNKEELEKKQAELRQTVDELSARIRRLEHHERQAKERQDRLRHQVDALRADLSTTRNTLKDANRYARDLHRYAGRLRQRLVDVYSSGTWKLGAPLRVVKQLLRGRLDIRSAVRPQVPDWPDSKY